MDNTGQENIDLREPVACWQKVLWSIISVLLLAFMIFCCCGGSKGDTGLAGRLFVLALVALPSAPCIVLTLFFWWGKKYLVIHGNAVVIYRELLGFKRTRCVIPGRNGRLVMRRVIIRETEHSEGAGGCFPKLELLITDSCGKSYRLLQFAVSERERMLAICQEICHRLPELKSVHEE